jgi:hypothetical protein
MYGRAGFDLLPKAAPPRRMTNFHKIIDRTELRERRQDAAISALEQQGHDPPLSLTLIGASVTSRTTHRISRSYRQTSSSLRCTRTTSGATSTAIGHAPDRRVGERNRMQWPRHLAGNRLPWRRPPISKVVPSRSIVTLQRSRGNAAVGQTVPPYPVGTGVVAGQLPQLGQERQRAIGPATIRLLHHHGLKPGQVAGPLLQQGQRRQDIGVSVVGGLCQQSLGGGRFAGQHPHRHMQPDRVGMAVVGRVHQQVLGTGRIAGPVPQPLIPPTGVQRATGNLRDPAGSTYWPEHVAAAVLALPRPAAGRGVLVLVHSNAAVVGPFDSPDAAHAWWDADFNRLAGVARVTVLPADCAGLDEPQADEPPGLIEIAPGTRGHEVHAAVPAKPDLEATGGFSMYAECSTRIVGRHDARRRKVADPSKITCPRCATILDARTAEQVHAEIAAELAEEPARAST